MKKILSILILALSASAYAQVSQLPVSECPAAGVILAREYVGIGGESVNASFGREGTMEIGTEAQFAGNLKARTFKVFNETICVAKVHTYQQQVCIDINPQAALGRGNADFAYFYDLNISLLKRAEQFSRTVKYGLGANQATRLTTANEIVKHLTRFAVSYGIPRSWDDFGAILSKIVAEAYITQAEFDDIIKVNALANRRELGFEPMTGIQSNEGKGNGKLQKMFDLGLTLNHRATIIKNTLGGVTDVASMNLAKSVIEFASVSGVPANWNQFVLMMKDAATKNAIVNEEFVNITQNLEIQNRINLGFDINYFSCKMESRQHHFNKVERQRANEFNSEVVKNFRLNIVSAPLLKNESETFNVEFHSLNGLSVSASQTFNSYTVESAPGEIEVVKLSGVRKRVTPKNTIATQVLHQGKYINVNLQNTEFNPLIGGKVVVEVEFYEKIVLRSDKKLAEKSFELTNGEMTAFTPNVAMTKSSRPAYVKVFMKIIGSPYYNEELTGFFKVEEK